MRNMFIITSKANQSEQEKKNYTKQANKQVISYVNLWVLISYDVLKY